MKRNIINGDWLTVSPGAHYMKRFVSLTKSFYLTTHYLEVPQTITKKWESNKGTLHKEWLVVSNGIVVSMKDRGKKRIKDYFLKNTSV